MSVKPSKIGQQFYIFRPKKANVESNVKPQPENNNVKSEELINMLMKKIESMNINPNVKNIYDEEVNQKVGAVEVDIKKEIYINKAEINKITSEEVKGKVNNKLDKLKALRKRK